MMKPERGAKAPRDGRGRLRAVGRLALAALAWLAVSPGLQALLAAGFGALFRAWGIDAANAHLAPGWARTVYAWHGSLITLLSCLVAAAVALALRRAWRLGAPRKASLGAGAVCAAIGLGAAVLTATLFLLTDSLRADWPLSEPRFTAGLPALLLLSLLGALAGELFGKGFVYDLLRPRFGHLPATLCAALLFALATGLGGGVIGAVNALLLGALCCLLYERRGLAAPVGLRWGWSAANLLLLGFGGGDSAVYRLYAVSEIPLTGGDAGPACGLWATLLLCAALAFAERRSLRGLLPRLRNRGRPA